MIKKLFPLFLFIFIFQSCNEILHTVEQCEEQAYKTSNPIFSEYSKEFEQTARRYLNNPRFKSQHIPINFGVPNSKNPSVAAICFSCPINSDFNEIIVLKNGGKIKILLMMTNPLLYTMNLVTVLLD